MKKTKNSAWKRVAAGALSMALVAGAMPANVGGFLTGGNAIVAHAAEYTAAETRVGLKLNVGDSFVIPESTHVNGYENMILWDRSTYDIGKQAFDEMYAYCNYVTAVTGKKSWFYFDNKAVYNGV